MIQRRRRFFQAFVCLSVLFFLLVSCSSLPLIGKKKDPKSADPDAKTVSIDSLESIKGVNPPKTESPAPPKQPSLSPPPQASAPKPSQTASLPPKSPYSSALPFFQTGLKKKVVVLDFENKTAYQEEKIGDAAAKSLSDKLEATQRLMILDSSVVEERLEKMGTRSEKLDSPRIMKQASQSLGIQAFVTGTVTDTSLVSPKPSEASDEEVSFATARIEVRLIEASTGNLLKTFIGRSPIFGTKESGENSRSKAVAKAIDTCLADILDGFLRQVDLLDWTTSIARIEADNLYVNAGRQSGLRIGDTLEVYEPGKEIFHPTTNLSLGWTTGKLKGSLRVTDLFGVDAAAAKIVQGQDFKVNDVVKSTAR